MTITINLPLATVEKLETQAAASGKDVETFVREAVEAKLLVSGMSLPDILEPIHKETEATGMSADELHQLGEDAVAEMRAARNASRR